MLIDLLRNAVAVLEVAEAEPAYTGFSDDFSSLLIEWDTVEGQVSIFIEDDGLPTTAVVESPKHLRVRRIRLRNIADLRQLLTPT